MDPTTYDDESAVEADHWWFKGRRRLFGGILRQIGLPRDARILDAGTSSGTNLRLMREAGFTNYVGLEISERAIELCAKKGLGPIEQGDILNMPFQGSSFDFAFVTDVIEHIDADDRALSEIARVLKPGGHCLITVPAFPSLWGHQDIVSHHKRRYRLRPLLQLVRAGGLQPMSWYYFNYLLFLPIWLVRLGAVALRLEPRSENRLNTPLLNAILFGLFTIDVVTAPWIRPPFGVSILVLCQKPNVD